MQHVIKYCGFVNVNYNRLHRDTVKPCCAHSIANVKHEIVSEKSSNSFLMSNHHHNHNILQCGHFPDTEMLASTLTFDL